MKSTTIIPGLSWGKALELFQSHGNISLEKSDSETFKSILEVINIDFETEINEKNSLVKFKLKRP